MSDEAAVRSYIAQKVRTIKDIGVVYDYDVLIKTGEEFETAFVYDDQLQGWTVRWNGPGSADPKANFLKYPESYTVVGFRGVNSEQRTDVLFGALVKSVWKLLSLDRSLGGLVTLVERVLVSEMGLVKIGGVYSHYCEVTVHVLSYE